MWKRLVALALALRGDLLLLWAALRHPQCPRWLKLGTAALVLYVLLPFDLIPDFIPGIGVVDDIVIVTFGVRWLLKRLPPDWLAGVRRAPGL